MYPVLGWNKSPKIQRRGMDRSEKSIWAHVYSFKKVARLHFPRSRPRGASKIPNKPQRRDHVLTFREKVAACETIALR